VSGIGFWEPNNHTILRIPGGGVLVSWLVSLLSEEIKGFIVKGECNPLLFLAYFVSSPDFFSSSSSDPIFSSYHIYFMEYSNSSSSPLFISISLNKTLSAPTIREYLPGVSDQRLYLLNSGLR
jgi:hypothetical protein